MDEFVNGAEFWRVVSLDERPRGIRTGMPRHCKRTSIGVQADFAMPDHQRQRRLPAWGVIVVDVDAGSYVHSSDRACPMIRTCPKPVLGLRDRIHTLD